MSQPWLNYHHLLYFHATAKEGSMTAAARRLRLAQPTLSAQIKQLEDMLGEPLFERRGRRLELTATGRTVYAYADEIFGLGQELVQAVQGRPTGRTPRLAVGVADTLPKLVVARLLAPTLDDTRLEVRDGDVPALMAELGVHRLDLVLSDAPLPSGSGIRAYSHALGESRVGLFAAPPLAERLRAGFPGTVEGAPLLLPGPGTALRRALDEWVDRLGAAPRVVAEVADSALMEALARAGNGAFAAPLVVADALTGAYGVELVGVAEGVVERFWALSPERRIRHPAVAAVVAGARRLFA